VKSIGDEAYRAIEVCRRAGVKLGLGTDILGHAFHPLQGGEFELRGRVEKPIDVLRSATSVNAELLQKSGELGQITPGAHADILVLDSDPFRDLTLFREPAKIPIVMKGGAFIRNAL
jgi:imidazolonepropionase-like amidohydrolase